MVSFQCSWCPSVNRCSTGTDRKRQEWMQNGCEQTQLRDSAICPALGTKGNNHDSVQPVNATPTKDESTISSGAEINRNGTKQTIDAKKAALSHADNDQPKSTHASFAAGILLPIVVVASLVLWVFYAYRNPHTKSGQLLIQVWFISIPLDFVYLFLMKTRSYKKSQSIRHFSVFLWHIAIFNSLAKHCVVLSFDYYICLVNTAFNRIVQKFLIHFFKFHAAEAYKGKIVFWREYCVK